jgi:hypothetical protein
MHGQLAGIQVNVGPFESQKLALPEPGVDGRYVEGFVASIAGGREECPNLNGGEGFGFLPVAAAAGTLADRNITGDQVIPHGVRERHL